MIFAATDLKVDNSSLTGESEPQERLPLPEGFTVRPVEAENLVNFYELYNSFSLTGGIGFQFYTGSQRRRLGRQVNECRCNVS
jgi:sodium/potassium-transporting ATPase subunit alpha